MQRGLLFLICATLLPFTFTSKPLLSIDDKEYYKLFEEEDIAGDMEVDQSVQMISSSSSNNYEEVLKASPKGRFGLINHSNICYMSAFITATFNIHSFREALYACEPRNATTVMLAEVFAKLQTANHPVSTDLCLMPTLTSDIGWRFGGFEDNLEFSDRIVDLLPESVKALCNTSMRTNYYLKESRTLLKTKIVPGTHYVIMPVFSSISGAIESRFRDESVNYIITRGELDEYEGIIAPFSEDKQDFPVISEVVIVNRPEIIVFGIGRRNPDGFNQTHMELDFEITLPGLEEGEEPVQYILQSFCYHSPGHYISYARDFTENDPQGVWYQYNDSKVTVVNSEEDYLELKKSANTAATLAFYVRADRVANRNYSEPEIPERIMRLAKLMLALEDVQERRSELKAAEKKKIYRSPPATKAEYSPNSIETVATLVSTPSRIYPVGHNLNDDEKKRSENLPSPTNYRFRKEFPADGDYSHDLNYRIGSA